MKPEIFADPVAVWLGPWPVTRTMLTTLALDALLVGLAVLLARAMQRRPQSKAAAAGRVGFRLLNSLVTEALGEPWPALQTLAGSLFMFIASASLIGQLPGVSAPTGNLATAAALAALVFIAVPMAGIYRNGLSGYLKHYVRPNPLLLPLHLISELSRTLALALRLFGNMMSGHLVVALIVALVGLFAPIPLMALDLLIGLLQAYIFTILACVYVGAAIRVGEES